MCIQNIFETLAEASKMAFLKKNARCKVFLMNIFMLVPCLRKLHCNGFHFNKSRFAFRTCTLYRIYE